MKELQMEEEDDSREREGEEREKEKRKKSVERIMNIWWGEENREQAKGISQFLPFTH